MKLTSSLNQFIVLAKIAETGGLSSAARELGMTPSAVSKSLSLLEEQLGVLLVRRTTRAVTLTTHGKMFFQRVSRILADVEDALDEVGDLRSQTKGDLHISCSIAFGCSQLVGIISRYKERYPDVNIHISLDDRLVNLGEENIDIALRIRMQLTAPMQPECSPKSAGFIARHRNILSNTGARKSHKISNRKTTNCWSIRL
jgi:DNA-binding transcriptional LysR family regulator